MTQMIPSYVPASRPTSAVQRLVPSKAHALCLSEREFPPVAVCPKVEASTLRLRSGQASAQHDNAEGIRPTLLKRGTGGSVGVAGVFAVSGLFLLRDLIPQALIAQNA